jgi:sulfotransferase family protein
MAHYPHSSHGRVGEVAPTYFASEQARSRVRELLPTAKIICVFRDPIERLISLYRLKRAYGWIPWNFEEAILSDPELTESSRYATHLKAWQRDFGVGQVLPTLFDDLRDRPQTYMNTVADFIGIPRFTLTSQDCRNIHATELMTLPRSYSRTRAARLIVEWLQARRFGRLVAVARKTPLHKLFLGGGPPFADPPTDLSLNLLELFRREVEELESMLQRDLSAWKPLSAALQTGQAA